MRKGLRWLLMITLAVAANAFSLTRTWIKIYDMGSENITNITERLNPVSFDNGTTWLTTLNQGIFDTVATWNVGLYTGFVPANYQDANNVCQRRPAGSENNFNYSAVQLQGNTCGFWQHSRSMSTASGLPENLLDEVTYRFPIADQKQAWAAPYSGVKLSGIASVPFMAVNTNFVKVHMRMRMTITYKDASGTILGSFTFKPTFFDVHGVGEEQVKLDPPTGIIMVRSPIWSDSTFTPQFMSIMSGSMHFTAFTVPETFTVAVDRNNLGKILEAVNLTTDATAFKFPIPADGNYTNYYLTSVSINSEMNPDIERDGVATLAKISGTFAELEAYVREDSE